MMTAHEIANALEDFDARHGSVMSAALAAYADDLRKIADEAQAAAANPLAPAEPSPGTIDITPTPAGFAGMAQMFREQAARADDAATAYRDLLNTVVPDDGEAGG